MKKILAQANDHWMRVIVPLTQPASEFQRT
jgi:hypothetical protein